MKAIIILLALSLLASALGGLTVELASGGKVAGRFYQRGEGFSELLAPNGDLIRIEHSEVVEVWSEDERDITQFFLSPDYGVKPQPKAETQTGPNNLQIPTQIPNPQTIQQPQAIYLMNEQTATILAQPFMIMGVSMAMAFGIGLVIALVSVAQ
ncbi:MAG: hypothetical protein PHG32_06710 [Candidatus Cloacimonetes bacterium]|nr:hypothetical protein [Candidatus Cloacimonadota bacterium]